LVSGQSGLNSELDGVIGLSRSKFHPNKDERNLGPLLIKQLADEGHLDANVFAIYMNDYKTWTSTNRPSFIDFGKI
jgi:hypothetical protein